MCMLSGAITAIFFIHLLYILELSALSSFFTGNSAIEKLFIIIIIIIIITGENYGIFLNQFTVFDLNVPINSILVLVLLSYTGQSSNQTLQWILKQVKRDDMSRALSITIDALINT